MRNSHIYGRNWMPPLRRRADPFVLALMRVVDSETR